MEISEKTCTVKFIMNCLDEKVEFVKLIGNHQIFEEKNGIFLEKNSNE